jgi:formylglycine-generating enzyme required for sulfatase activity
MSEALNLIQRDLPYIHDFGETACLQLQRDAAARNGIDLSFTDHLANGGQGPEMVVIPAGQFEMGAPKFEFGVQPEEMPQHYVGIARDFALGKYTVTADEFAIFCQASGWKPRSELIWATGRHPVINIGIADALLYIEWLNQETGQRYRLPTEAEWEYAARAGTLTAFSHGESVDCKQVHFNAAFPYAEAKAEKKWFLPRCFPLPRALEVGSKPPNLWGLYEVHGNVWEFTASPWTNSHVGHPRDGQSSDLSAQWFVTKGGSWFDAAIWSRSAARKPRFYNEIDVNLGLRLLREL